jgi:hypothetical protein
LQIENFKLKFSISKLRNITHLLNSEHNHHAYGKAHALTYSFRELADEAYLVGITAMLPEMRFFFQQYFDIVDGVRSR